MSEFFKQFSIYLQQRIESHHLVQDLTPYFKSVSKPDKPAGGRLGLLLRNRSQRELWDKGFGLHREALPSELILSLKQDKDMDLTPVEDAVASFLEKSREVKNQRVLSLIINGIQKYETGDEYTLEKIDLRIEEEKEKRGMIPKKVIKPAK